MTDNPERHLPKETFNQGHWASQDSLARLLFMRQYYLDMEESPAFTDRAKAIVAAAELLIEEMATTHPEIITSGSELEQLTKAVLVKRHPRPGYKLDLD